MGCSAYRCRHGSDWNNVRPFLGPFFSGVARLTGVLINDFFQRCFLKVSYQFMFLNKVPCRAARVLDVDECPINALIHDPRNYPKFMIQSIFLNYTMTFLYRLPNLPHGMNRI